MNRSVKRSGARLPSAQRPAERARSADLPRHTAYESMRAIDQGAYANLDLPSRLRRAGLRGRDAAFTTELVYGATRLRGFYDPILARCAGRPVSQIDPEVLDTLRLGAHQLLGMRVPSHAAVDEAVAAARQLHGVGAAGFSNAVLRRVSEKDATEWERILTKDLDPIAALAVRYSHPEWVVRALRTALVGHGGCSDVDAELLALLQADNTPAKVTLVARPGLCDVTELTAAGADPASWSPLAAVLAEGGDPRGIRAVRQGRAAVQDEGSQLIPLALAAADLGPVADEPDRPVATRAWLDLCAGPGGKAALLAVLAHQRQVTLFANDLSTHRSDLVRTAVRAAVKAGAEVMIGTGDGCTLGAQEPGAYDRVLVDAPCTGLGALRRRPEARWRRSPHDIPEMTALQARLLSSALQAARPGGVVAYATCSPHLAETRYLVTDVLRHHPGIELLDAQAVLADVTTQPIRGLGDPPFVQLWPHRHGTDGMFLALMQT